MLIPRLVAQTVQLTRAVIEVINLPAGAEVKVSLPPEKPHTLTEEVFISQIHENVSPQVAEGVKQLIAEIVNLGLIKRWGAISVSLRFPDPRGVKDFTVLVINNAGRFYLGWLSELEKCGYDPAIAAHYRDKVMLLTGARPSGSDGTKETPMQALLAQKTDFLKIVTEFLDELRIAASQKESN